MITKRKFFYASKFLPSHNWRNFKLFWKKLGLKVWEILRKNTLFDHFFPFKYKKEDISSKVEMDYPKYWSTISYRILFEDFHLMNLKKAFQTFKFRLVIWSKHFLQKLLFYSLFVFPYILCYLIFVKPSVFKRAFCPFWLPKSSI